MSEVVAEGVISAGRLREFIGVYNSDPPGVEGPFVDECKIHFNDDGFTVNVVEPANNALIKPSRLASEAFEHYDAPGSVTIGVDLDKLDNFLGPADADTLVNFAVDMETRKLRLHYGNADIDMALIDPDAIRQEPDLPDLDLPNWFVITGEQLADALDVVGLVSDHVTVSVDAEERDVTFSGAGDVDSSGVTYSKSDCQDSELRDESESKFSMDYLRMFAHPIPDDAAVTIDVGTDYPMMLEWRGIEDHLEVNQLLAPRVSSE